MHFCKFPFEVWKYYAPADENGNLNEYAEVESLSEEKTNDDEKFCCTKLKVNAKISLSQFIQTGVEAIFEKCNNKNTNSNTGYWSAAIVTGKESIAVVTGYQGKAKGTIGNWIVLTERGEWNGETYPILDVKAFKVDGITIKEDTFYMLVNGESVEVNDEID